METMSDFAPISSTSTSVSSRFKAAGIHFAISLLIAIGITMLMLTIWYPPPYLEAIGGDQLLVLIIGVDVALGPLLTLIVFDVKKKSLKIDLAIIAFVQLLALCYGVYSMFEGRPVYTVFVKDKFEIVTANEIEDGELVKVTRPEFKSLPVTGPVVVAAIEPTEAKELSFVETAAGFGMGLQNLPQYYQSYDKFRAKVLSQAKSMAFFQKNNPAEFQRIGDALKRTKKLADEVVFISCIGKSKNLTVLLDRRSGEIIEFLSVVPPT